MRSSAPRSLPALFPSSLRTQGPITTDVYYFVGRRLHYPTENPRRMGPCFRRDDVRDAPPSQMREIMRQRLDLFLAEGKGDIGHRRHRAAGPHARFVIAQRLHEIFLALPGDAAHPLGAAMGIRVP